MPWFLVVAVLAILLLVLRAVGVNHPRVDLGWIGLALWAFAALILA
jgi:hypothetical protein